jgi:hypothetical protein
LEFFITETPPLVAFIAAADAAGRKVEALAALRDTIVATNEATDGTCRVTSPYVRCIATRPG